VIHKPRLFFKSSSPKFYQKGGALILMVFIIGLGTAAYMLKALNASNLQAEQDKKTYQTLNAAKQALISWAVADRYSPGQLPWPDRNGDDNYDGSSDCVAGAGTFQYKFLLGQLPSLPTTSPCLDPNNGLSVYVGLSTYQGLGQRFNDAQGNALWYAVSKNMVRDYELSINPIINPSLVNKTTDWIQILDRNGNLISDRVAAVLIAPGAPVGDQDRSGAAPTPDQYLDRIVRASDSQPFKNYGYPVNVFDDNQFIMGDDGRTVSDSDSTFQKPYYFNDKLVYITIDELMAALSMRVGAEAKTQLINYKKFTAPSATESGYYPYASPLLAAVPYQFTPQYAGFLPTQTSSKSCLVTYTSANASSATCDFSSITNVEFTRTSGTFTSVTGSECTRTNSNKTCQCAITSGSSRCNGSSGRRFTCTNTGCTTAGTLPGSYKFNGVFTFSTAPTSVRANSSSGACTGCGTNIASCSYTATKPSGSFAYYVTTQPDPFNSAITNSALPAWFFANNWQDYLYYAVSTNCTYGAACDTPDIKVGAKPSVQAMIATTGAPIIISPYGTKNTVAQTHSGCDVKDYLDSVENTNSDTTFEANNKQRASNYNDQTFAVHHVQP